MKTINKQLFVQKASFWLAFLFIGQTAWATDWLAVTSGTTKNLYGTYFKNDTTVFAMGASGTLLKSVDKGNTWSAVSSGVTDGLRNMCFLNDTLGFIVGDNGLILKTINAGGSWSSISSGTTEILRKMYIKNDSTLFVVGYTGTILKCINLGAWVNSGSLNSGSINDILFVNDSIGYAVGDGFSVKSTDGGATWFYLTSGGTYSFRTICSPDTNKIFMTDGYGILYKTMDGGNTWENDTLSTSGLYGMTFVSKKVGYIVGYYGLALKTIDGGETFTTMTTPSTVSTKTFNTAVHGDSATVVAVGSSGKIIKLAYTLAIDKNTITPNAVADTSVVTITSNTTWTAASSDSWLTIPVASGKNNGSIQLIAAANTTGTERTATVTLSGTVANPVTITVTQAAGTVTAIGETPGDVTLAMYPNPVSSTLTIQTALPIQGVIVTDLSGNVVATGKTTTMDMSRLSKGLYLVQVRTEKGVTSRKISKE